MRPRGAEVYLEDAGGGGEGLLELLAQDGGGALVADSLARGPRANSFLHSPTDQPATPRRRLVAARPLWVPPPWGWGSHGPLL